MTITICTIYKERIGNKVLFDSYESAVAILEPGTFVEETEETGTIHIGSKWDGTSWIEATEEELAAYYEDIEPVIEEPINE
jgi:hypothetical protein